MPPRGRSKSGKRSGSRVGTLSIAFGLMLVDDDATAEVLRRHLADAGVRLPVVAVPSGPTPHSPASAIVAGTWRDAAAIARLAGAAEVVAWTLEPEWVPEEVEGVPFDPARPDARVSV